MRIVQIKENIKRQQTKGSEGLLIQDDEFLFYRDLMESLHCYLLHPNATNDEDRIKQRFTLKFDTPTNKHTLSEQIIKFISKQIDIPRLEKMERYFGDEEYDTDAMQYDLSPTHHKVSNIAMTIDAESAHRIQRGFYLARCMFSSV